MSSVNWSTVLELVQTVAVACAVVFGLYELRELRRRRGWESLEKMLEEWRASLPLHLTVLAKLPAGAGDVSSRAEALAQYIRSMCGSVSTKKKDECVAMLTASRDLVHSLNDLGVYVDAGVVDQRTFFGQFHIRILELAFVLEPYVVLMSACRDSRWGLRLRRLRIGAERYHHCSRVHRDRPVEFGGHVVLRAKRARYLPPFIREQRLRWSLIPTKVRCRTEEDRLMAQVRERVDEMLSADGITCREFVDSLPVQV